LSWPEELNTAGALLSLSLLKSSGAWTQTEFQILLPSLKASAKKHLQNTSDFQRRNRVKSEVVALPSVLAVAHRLPLVSNQPRAFCHS
jgi:hypothetical protein